ncbi:MAG: ATP-binding protein [Nitrospirae bacterium]|nr:ATP-binding protein [Nitrospirota bacterium]
MEREKIRELITAHTRTFLARKDLVSRELQREISRLLPQREIVLISGVRRSGKSSLMRLICDDIIIKEAVTASNILYVNFEDERFVDFTIRDFEPLYEAFLELQRPKGKKFLFFDEIQNIPGWEKWLNRLYEFEDLKIFVSGSNAAMLSSDISTALTGRNRQVVNWPFSFMEFLSLRDCSVRRNELYSREKRLEIKHLFKQYLETGGFPEVIKNNDPTLLEQYFRDILYRDIISRHSIKNIKEIRELTLFLAANIGTVQSYKNLQHLAGLKSIATVKNYVETLADVFLFYFIDMFSFSVKRQIYNPSKVYCVDAALSDSISFRFSRNLGHAYENIVCIELLRRKGEIYYWKSKKGKEVDFIVKEGMKITHAIQVCFSLSDKKVIDREIQALIDVKNELNPKHLLILTEDEDGTKTVGGAEISIVPVWKWLIPEWKVAGNRFEIRLA